MEFIFTASIDGFVKFWKKAPEGVEFVKTYRAHLSRISDMALSNNQERLATICAADQTYKLFDVISFDLMHMVKLNWIPSICCFIEKQTSFSPILCIGDGSEVLRVVKAEQVISEKGKPGPNILKVLKELHSEPVRLIKYNKFYSVVFSTDQSGLIEIWDPETFDFPTSLSFDCISDTDLFTLVEKETYALHMEFTPDG